MPVARRPLLTATAAGTLLCALWFVPSANATDEQVGPGRQSAVSAQSVAAEESGTAVEAHTAAESDASVGSGPSEVSDGSERSAQSGQPALADTGSVDTTPYVFGGTACLGIGAGFVAYSLRRSGRAF
ncbi:hypothetical protein [Streptomyces sp. NPDC088400]|uniref:hypothetical protein n=1 Tax=Streptomyces sp. NPDC088400 TaxID=3365861 RepID=UPI003816E1D0